MFELVFRHLFKVLEILPDVVLVLPWLRSCNPTVNWKERYADIQHGASLYRLSFDESRHSTQLQFQAASKLDLLSILSSSASEASPVGHPTPMPRNAPTYTRRHTSSTVLTCTMSQKRKMVSPMRSAAIWRLSTFRCRKSKERPVELISEGIKCFCAAYLDPQCRSIKCIRCKQAMTMTGLTPFDANCLLHCTSRGDLYDREKAEYGDLPPHQPGRDHRIRLVSEDNPPWVHPYKMDPSQLDELRRQLDKLHRSGRIRPSLSPYRAGCLLVEKANGKWRMCVDYRALNTRTVRDWYPLPSIQSILSTLGGSTLFSKIDLVSGFYEIRIHDEDIEKTAFNTQFGAFERVVMPFGLCNSPSTFQHVVNDVLRDHLLRPCNAMFRFYLSYQKRMH